MPWKGYFELINYADEFYFHDDVKYTKNDWRNRNQIFLNYKKKWITIPCGVKGNRKINEVFIADHKWKKKHFNMIYEAYRSSEYYKDYIEFFHNFYLENKLDNLSQINKFLIKYISKKILNIDTKFFDVEDLNISSKKQDRVFDICKKVGANIYISGPNGKNYLKEKDFDNQEIRLEYFNYGPYLKYNQFSNKFNDTISILDLIFHCGPNSKDYILSK